MLRCVTPALRNIRKVGYVYGGYSELSFIKFRAEYLKSMLCYGMCKMYLLLHLQTRYVFLNALCCHYRGFMDGITDYNVSP